MSDRDLQYLQVLDEFVLSDRLVQSDGGLELDVEEFIPSNICKTSLPADGIVDSFGYPKTAEFFVQRLCWLVVVLVYLSQPQLLFSCKDHAHETTTQSRLTQVGGELLIYLPKMSQE